MNYKGFLTLSLIFLLADTYCQSEEYSQTVRRSFLASDNVTVSVSNKYGTVSLATWDKDSVAITIDLIIKAKDSQKLEKLKNSIDFDFSSGQYFITANTVIGDGGNDIIKDIVDIAGNYFSSSNSVTINYNLMLPENLPVKIENRFGDVYAGDFSSNLRVDMSYGDFKANNLNGGCEISLASGDAEINYINEGQLSVSYSNLRIKRADKLYLETRSSNDNIEEVNEIKIDSRRDKIFLGESSIVTGDGYFTDFNITQAQNTVNLKLRYGSISIENILKDFSLVNLSSDYADMDLGFSGPLNFQFDLTQSPDVTFVYPKSYASLESEVVNEEEGILNFAGSFGQGSEASRVIIIASRKCELIISYK